jgi:drug/metabolite transporter (DMT)-like permease
MLVPAGIIVMVAMKEPPIVTTLAQSATLALTLGVGVFSYYALVASMRVGELSFVTPFRYTRILFALIVAVLVFGERPDALTLMGASLIVAAGMFTLWREMKAG